MHLLGRQPELNNYTGSGNNQQSTDGVGGSGGVGGRIKKDHKNLHHFFVFLGVYMTYKWRKHTTNILSVDETFSSSEVSWEVT